MAKYYQSPMSSQKPISKSAFIKAEQCLKHFYLYKNHYYLRDPLSKEKQLVFKRGIDVGIYAQQMFPGGVDVTAGSVKHDTPAFAQKTQEAIRNGVKVIYEATFIYDDLLAMVDILVLHEEGWCAYEVKSSLKISETYVKDACFQYYVLKHSLNNLSDFCLLTMNPNYVKHGAIDIHQLFKKTSVKKDAEKNLSYFSYKAQLAKSTLEQQKIPDIQIGPHCFTPYTCDFMGTCWKHEERDESIFNLGKVSKQELFELYHSGQKSISQIDATRLEKASLRMQVEAVQQNHEMYNREAIAQFLQQVKTPMCSIDIEVWSPALPLYEGTKPFEQIPFLFSLAAPDESGTIRSSYFLKEIAEDKREQFLVALLNATDSYESILVYDKTLEEQVLNKCGILFPQYIERITYFKKRIIDLFEVIDKGYYYHPLMKGNFSLKGLAPIVDPGAGFENLAIQSGITAMYTYEALLSVSNELETEAIRAQLIEYCNQDAEITLKLFHFLRARLG
ncbi:MAG: DUF2779 domain-containing protein [Bacteroidetes bacterium]|nr:DUF2779 domain-containing protein [Bacteroidota bacterium]